ncbi:MAG: hypothetical protein HYU67_00520 [Flavobacteriia bacterium]|nr:hypothetical protein [Flavobacteriia bacterium]
MIKTIVCSKCTKSIKVDFDKAPRDKFTIACPECQQKYILEKPKKNEDSVKLDSTDRPIIPQKIKNIPCPKCKSQLKIDFNRIVRFPAIISCRSCETKIKLNDPSLPKKIETG